MQVGDGDRANEHAPLIPYSFKDKQKTVNLNGSGEERGLEAVETKGTGSRYSFVPRPLSFFCVRVGKKGSGGSLYVVLCNRELGSYLIYRIEYMLVL